MYYAEGYMFVNKIKIIGHELVAQQCNNNNNNNNTNNNNNNNVDSNNNNFE